MATAFPLSALPASFAFSEALSMDLSTDLLVTGAKPAASAASSISATYLKSYSKSLSQDQKLPKLSLNIPLQSSISSTTQKRAYPQEASQGTLVAICRLQPRIYFT
jgi:hypothetical protein